MKIKNLFIATFLGLCSSAIICMDTDITRKKIARNKMAREKIARTVREIAV